MSDIIKDDHKTKARSMRVLGMSYKDIAKELCRSPSTIYGWAKDIKVSGKVQAELNLRGSRRAGELSNQRKYKPKGSEELFSMKVEDCNIGQVSETAVLLGLILRGFQVLQPVGVSKGYDFVIESNGSFMRIQVKTMTKYDTGTPYCKTVKTTGHNTQVYLTKEDCDAVVGYYPPTNEYHVWLIDELGGGRKAASNDSKDNWDKLAT